MKNLIISFVLLFSSMVYSEELHIAVAANFAAPIQKIAAAFKQDTGHTVLLSLGATGTLYAQIKHGAPFDILLAADNITPKKLAQENLAIADTRFTYSIGKLALWSKEDDIIINANSLRNQPFNYLAIANPKLAPYGAAAMQTLTQLNLLDAVNNKIVQGENIAQTYQFVASKNAEIGFVALSQIMENGKIRDGSAWIVPSSLYSPIKQQAITLQAGENLSSAKAFIAFLQSPKARDIIQSYGYDIP